MRGPAATPFEVARVRELAAQGRSMRAIAWEIGRSPDLVRRILAVAESEDRARALESDAATIVRGAQAAAELGPDLADEASTLLQFADVFALFAEGMRQAAVRAAARSDSPSRRPGRRGRLAGARAARRAKLQAHDRACDALIMASPDKSRVTQGNKPACGTRSVCLASLPI